MRNAQKLGEKSGSKTVGYGPAVAAMISSMVGLIFLALVNLGTTANKAFETWVFNIGKLWIPSAQGIGPYSGKETFMLIAWLGSWLVLHKALKRRQVDLALGSAIFMAGVAAATLLMWEPVIVEILRG